MIGNGRLTNRTGQQCRQELVEMTGLLSGAPVSRGMRAGGLSW